MIEFNLEWEGVWEEVHQLAALRNAGKENLASTDIRTSYNPNIVGCAGEMAFELATGLEMDRRQLKYGDAGWDFILPPFAYQATRTLVDVKTKTIMNGFKGEIKFWLKEKDLTKDCDLFVFVLMDKMKRGDCETPLPTVQLAWWIEQGKVEDIAEWRRNRSGKLEYTLRANQLHPIEDLFTLDANGDVVWTQ